MKTQKLHQDRAARLALLTIHTSPTGKEDATREHDRETNVIQRTNAAEN